MNSIKNNVENTIEIKKSKFICKIYKINNELEIKNILLELRKEYKDSTHICYGYILNGKEKCNDDGEPSGTAGLPILNILKKKELNYVLCVVIRYFGGIKLGAGGLVRAYTNSVVEAIKKTSITNLKEYIEVEIEFEYNNTKAIDNIIKEYKILDKSFNDAIKYIVLIEKNSYNKIESLLTPIVKNINQKKIILF